MEIRTPNMTCICFQSPSSMMTEYARLCAVHIEVWVIGMHDGRVTWAQHQIAAYAHPLGRIHTCATQMNELN